jgi:hypothetical protein
LTTYDRLWEETDDDHEKQEEPSRRNTMMTRKSKTLTAPEEGPDQELATLLRELRLVNLLSRWDEYMAKCRGAHPSVASSPARRTPGEMGPRPHPAS